MGQGRQILGGFMKEHNKKSRIEDSYLVIEPLAESAVENAGGEGIGDENPILQLQLTMATQSINHEYARMEYADTLDSERQEELLSYMSACREKYFEARESLHTYDPSALQDFEKDLLEQKMRTLNRYNA